jgi:hypothetical protein
VLYLDQDGERVDIDHLTHETIVYLLMAGAEIKERSSDHSEDGLLYPLDKGREGLNLRSGPEA